MQLDSLKQPFKLPIQNGLLNKVNCIQYSLQEELQVLCILLN